MEKPSTTLNATLDELQTEDQRSTLDTITRLRKCGLESILSLPDIVVCGDQSAGKSSVLEALTEIPFPRNDNLCTRFATEISLRREPSEKLTIRVIPDNGRSAEEQARIQAFSEIITDLKDLPVVMDAATKVMGIGNGGSAFSKDTLSVEITGPDRPQLTLIDIPGLIQSTTKGIAESDVVMVSDITDRYIKRPRTICLAVVSAINDAANQSILQRVRKFDPQGGRTLGVITKPDLLPKGSGSETKFIELARNEDVFFKLGWHVIRNRRFEENAFSFKERNAKETQFFDTSNYKVLPKDTVGIESLRKRLSHLLFDHVKAELPQLSTELERILQGDRDELKLLGLSRSDPVACRLYLAQLSMECQEICKAGLIGNYGHEYFKSAGGEMFSLSNKNTVARLRAAIQYTNSRFSEALLCQGHKYDFSSTTQKSTNGGTQQNGKSTSTPEPTPASTPVSTSTSTFSSASPKPMSKKESMGWVQQMLLRSRGTELIGSFNPLLVGELFWEQSQPWEAIASTLIEQVGRLCKKFFTDLLDQKAPEEIRGRIRTILIQDRLNQRKQAAYDELAKLIGDLKEFPINYNHYYTDTIETRRQERSQAHLQSFVPKSVAGSKSNCNFGTHFAQTDIDREIGNVISSYAKSGTTTTGDMNKFSSEEALDCLEAIYKVQSKTFIANVTTQVIERQMIRGLDGIFSPLVVIGMTDKEVEAVASERPSTKHRRAFLQNRVQKLEDGRRAFQELIRCGYD